MGADLELRTRRDDRTTATTTADGDAAASSSHLHNPHDDAPIPKESLGCGGGNAASRPQPQVEWEKVLYRRQPFPDNYSGGDERFLAELRKNENAVLYSFGEAVRAALHLLCHLNILIVKFLLFEYVQDGSVTLSALCALAGSISIGVYLVYILVIRDKQLPPPDISDHFRTLMTIVGLGYVLTPIIRTLTTSISTDSIYAMSLGSATVSCLFHDYGGIKTPLVWWPLSLSTGLSSSVLLISRLEENATAFAFLSLSFPLHAYSSVVRNRLFSGFPRTMVLSGCLACLSGTYLLWINSRPLAIAWILTQIFIAFVCPLLLMRLQKRKRTIHGPWDEAVLKRRKRVHQFRFS